MMDAPFNIMTSKPQRVPIPTIKPNAADEKFVRDAMAYLVFRAPFFAHILYSEMQVKYCDDSMGFPVAATDAHSIFINVNAIKRYSMKIPEMAFVLAHEVGHYIFCDLVMSVKWRQTGTVLCSCGPLPYDHETMNKAQDYRINAMLIASKIGAMPAGCPGLYEPAYSREGMESCIEIYAKIYQQRGGSGGRGRPGQQGQGNPQPGGGVPDHGGFDHHLDPAEKAQKDADSGAQSQSVVAAAESAAASGKGNLPAALRALLGEILDPKVSWQDKLKSTMLRHGGDPMLDWSQPDKRHISRPSPYDPIVFARQGHMGAGTVVIGYDTSGSCVNPDVQQRFFSEMAGIVDELNPQRLIVVWCDADVQRVDDLEEIDDLEGLRAEINELGGAPGGGGTDFCPVFEWVEENEIIPDMMVYLTDTYGSFPDQEPDYPVIWCSIAQGSEVPWGELIEVELV